eukprot:275686-Prymnesium_polylepis.1
MSCGRRVWGAWAGVAWQRAAGVTKMRGGQGASFQRPVAHIERRNGHVKEGGQLSSGGSAVDGVQLGCECEVACDEVIRHLFLDLLDAHLEWEGCGMWTWMWMMGGCVDEWMGG